MARKRKLTGVIAVDSYDGSAQYFGRIGEFSESAFLAAVNSEYSDPAVPFRPDQVAPITVRVCICPEKYDYDFHLHFHDGPGSGRFVVWGIW